MSLSIDNIFHIALEYQMKFYMVPKQEENYQYNNLTLKSKRNGNRVSWLHNNDQALLMARGVSMIPKYVSA